MNQAESCGKVILIGEHAVVYNIPAIAFPLKEILIKVSIEDSKEFSVSSKYGFSTVNSRLYEHEGVFKIVEEFKKKYLKKEEANINIKIESDIPSEGGLGSSAAVSNATILALAKHYNIKLSEKKQFKFIQIGEKIHHKNPSGLDGKTVLYEKPIYFIKNRVTKKMKINFEGYLIIGDTGLESKTVEAVSLVREFKNNNENKFKEILREIKQVTKKAKKALVTNDFNLLKSAITNNQLLLESLGVSDITLEKLIKTAILNGASAAKLTGGGIGGSMVALSKNKMLAKEISDSLLKAGAKKTYILDIGTFK